MSQHWEVAFCKSSHYRSISNSHRVAKFTRFCKHIHLLYSQINIVFAEFIIAFFCPTSWVILKQLDPSPHGLQLYGQHASIINKHNKKVTSIDTKPNSQDQCNCRDKDQCPIDNNCLTSGIIYNARVTTDDTPKIYIGLTEGIFKQRFMQHKHSFRHRSHMNSTELSKYIWQLCDSKKDFNIKWPIICRATLYSNITKRCDLCTTEKLMIINSKPDELLNKRSELISKCRHENKFYLRNN